MARLSYNGISGYIVYKIITFQIGICGGITIVDKAVIYIHGKGGNAEEAIHYKPLFSNCDVIGLDYTAQFSMGSKRRISHYFLIQIYRN